jgi:hypothetical protein
MCSCIHIIAEKASFLEELLPTLVGTILGGGISVGLAVYLFREENKRDNLIREQENSSQSELRKSEIDRQWYMNVLVNPNLNRIEDFFEIINGITQETAEQLNAAKNGMVREYHELKAIRRTLFKNEIRRFEYSLIKLIQTNSSKVSEDLMEWLRSFDDIISNFEDQIFNTEQLDMEQLLQRLSSSKAEFYKILSRPLKVND